MDAIAQTNYDQTMAIRDYTNSISKLDQQMAQVDARMTELRDIIQSNNVVILTLREENSHLAGRTDQYSNLVVTLQTQIKQANESIVLQNDALKKLVAERDEYVNRLNESIKERNEVVTKYNELVKQVEAIQAAQQPKKDKK
jgi:uncharacterized coiled-coil DUF342 family protein